jgi:hypothetical protein
MEFFTSPAPEKISHDIVEIRLLEMFLTYSADLRTVLLAHAIGNAPLQRDHSPGRVTFRFETAHWQYVKHLLYEHRIPVVVRSGLLQAVKVKGAGKPAERVAH